METGFAASPRNTMLLPGLHLPLSGKLARELGADFPVFLLNTNSIKRVSGL
jgi:hypothetical protein